MKIIQQQLYMHVTSQDDIDEEQALKKEEERVESIKKAQK